ncbi:hypothetical protein H0H93_012650 [Arthromyces matolae]|nr:hypothetical protein H0H93_012650 [Arthromyces matolae]
MNPRELSFEEPNPRWIGARGPVTMMPTYLRNIPLLPEFRVEFLNSGGDATENHTAIQVNFAQTVNIGGVDYLGARISMDPLQYPHDAQNFRVCDSADDETRFRYMDAEDHYLPGVFTIRFNTYDRPSTESLHTVFFPMRSDLTLGELLNVATLNELHRFVFLPYKTSTGKAWKGCRDFV